MGRRTDPEVCFFPSVFLARCWLVAPSSGGTGKLVSRTVCFYGVGHQRCYPKRENSPFLFGFAKKKKNGGNLGLLAGIFGRVNML